MARAAAKKAPARKQATKKAAARRPPRLLVVEDKANQPPRVCSKGRCNQPPLFHHSFVLESGAVHAIDLCTQHEQQMLRTFEPWFSLTYVKRP